MYEVLEVWGIMLEYIIIGAKLLNYDYTAVSKAPPYYILIPLFLNGSWGTLGGATLQ